MRDFDLDPATACGLIIDVQERFVPAIPAIGPDGSALKPLTNLIAGLALLDVPLVISEQVPDKLGPTIEPVRAAAPAATPVLAKQHFSCLDDAALRDAINATAAEVVIVAGIEAHVCVLATVDDLLRRGFRVVVVDDAVASRNPDHRTSAIAALRDLGALVVPCESVLFRLQRIASGDRFRALSRLVK